MGAGLPGAHEAAALVALQGLWNCSYLLLRCASVQPATQQRQPDAVRSLTCVAHCCQGGLPVAISSTVQPTDQMSAAVPRPCCRTTSGACSPGQHMGMCQAHRLLYHSVKINSSLIAADKTLQAGRQRPAHVPAPPTIQCAEPLKDLLTDTCSASCLAMPKSASLRRPVVSTSRLAPLMSRCTVCWL
jgi:hypothetical protein